MFRGTKNGYWRFFLNQVLTNYVKGVTHVDEIVENYQQHQSSDL